MMVLLDCLHNLLNEGYMKYYVLGFPFVHSQFVQFLLLAFRSIFCSRFLFCLCLVQLFRPLLYYYFTHFHHKEPDDLTEDIPISHFVSSMGLRYHYQR